MIRHLNIYDWISIILLIIGGLNWGAIALNVNLVRTIVHNIEWLERLIYILVGLSSIWVIIFLAKGEKRY